MINFKEKVLETTYKDGKIILEEFENIPKHYFITIQTEEPNDPYGESWTQINSSLMLTKEDALSLIKMLYTILDEKGHA